MFLWMFLRAACHFEDAGCSSEMLHVASKMLHVTSKMLDVPPSCMSLRRCWMFLRAACHFEDAACPFEDAGCSSELHVTSKAGCSSELNVTSKMLHVTSKMLHCQSGCLSIEAAPFPHAASIPRPWMFPRAAGRFEVQPGAAHTTGRLWHRTRSCCKVRRRANQTLCQRRGREQRAWHQQPRRRRTCERWVRHQQSG